MGSSSLLLGPRRNEPRRQAYGRTGRSDPPSLRGRGGHPGRTSERVRNPSGSGQPHRSLQAETLARYDCPEALEGGELSTVALAYLYGNLQGPFVRSLLDVTRFDRRIKEVLDQPATLVADGRNEVVERFLRGSSDWLWFVDTDVVLPQTILDKLLDRADEDHLVLAAPYPIFVADRVVPSWVLHGERTFWSGELTHLGPHYLDACGMGCTLIARPVLEALRDASEPEDPWKWFGHDLVEGFRAGEDVTFCARARALGFTIWGIPMPFLRHLKTQPLPYEPPNP